MFMLCMGLSLEEKVCGFNAYSWELERLDLGGLAGCAGVTEGLGLRIW